MTLGQIVDEPRAILIALLFRFITVIGDMVYYALVITFIPSRQDEGDADADTQS